MIHDESRERLDDFQATVRVSPAVSPDYLSHLDEPVGVGGVGPQSHLSIAQCNVWLGDSELEVIVSGAARVQSRRVRVIGNRL